MRILMKMILFFSVPSILFALFAVPSLRDGGGRADGSAWGSLSESGVHYLRPQGWRVVEPLTATTPITDDRWAMTWPARRRVNAACFVADDGASQLLLFVGDAEDLVPIAEEANGYYRESVMVERAPRRRERTADGLELRVEQARYLPGPVAGRDASMLLAWGARDGRAVLANAGGPTETFPADDVLDVLRALSLD